MGDGPVVVTGAAGFIGRALCARFASSGRPHRGVVRAAAKGATLRSTTLVLGDLALTPEDQLEAAMEGASAVVHLAGRAHVLRETASDPDAAFDAANVVATARVARAALRAGVARFIFASTIKVHGETTAPGKPFRASDGYAPLDAYARSKVAAEKALLAACADTWMVPVILRLPLVYGPGVKGNFATLLDAIARRAILPFGAIVNQRSLLYAGNLVAAIDRLLDQRTALSGAWLVAETHAISTPALVRGIAGSLGVKPRLWPVPLPVLAAAARIAGREGELSRVTTSLEVDASPLWERIGAPPDTLGAGLDATALWWRARHAL